MSNQIVEATRRVNAIIHPVQDISFTTAAIHALFNGSENSWVKGKLSSARIPQEDTDVPILGYLSDGIVLNSLEGGPYDIDYEGTSDEMQAILHQVTMLSQSLFGRIDIQEGAYLTPGTPMAKLSSELDTADILLYTCLFYHLYTSTSRLTWAEQFGNGHTFSPDEFISALLFYLLLRFEEEDTDFSTVSQRALEAVLEDA